MIEVTDLTKSYGPVQALQGVSFEIKQGEIVGLLGPNGAGKSTLIKTLTGYLQPDGGDARIAGLDVLTDTLEIQGRIGYLPENAPLYPDLSVQSYLKLMADLRQIPEEEQPGLLSAAIRAASLQEYLIRPIGQLSKGLRQRVGLAQAILHRPQLLILDEPTIGLDPTQIVEIRNLIRRLSASSTILFSTHILSEVEALCDRVIILMNGKIKADAHLSELAESADAILVLQHEADDVMKALSGLDGVNAIQQERTPDGFPAYRVRGRNDTQPPVDLSPAIYELARAHDWPLRELRRDVRTLESVFNELATAE